MRKRDWAQKKINKDSHRDISLTTNRQKPKEGLGVKKVETDIVPFLALNSKLA